MPRARVKMAMAVKAGAFANIRNAYLKSVSITQPPKVICPHLFITKNNNGIYARRATRRQQASDCDCERQDRAASSLSEQIRGWHLSLLALHKTEVCAACNPTGDKSASKQTPALSCHE